MQRIAQRAFVLYPLQEIAPELDIPGHGKLSELLNACPANGIRKLETHALRNVHEIT